MNVLPKTAHELGSAMALLNDARNDLQNLEQDALEILSSLNAARGYLGEVAAGFCVMMRDSDDKVAEYAFRVSGGERIVTYDEAKEG